MRPEIHVRRLGVRFNLDRQKRPVTPAMSRLRLQCSTVWAFRELSFDVLGGSGVALIGSNGVGKTTLLRALADVLTPDEGSIEVCGRIGSLLSIQAGLMPRLTGRENSLLLGVLAGLPRSAVRQAMPTIIRQSGLESAFDRPVSTYSQGMRARLGFAVVELTNPDILLLDEVIEAIDESFRAHVEERVKEILSRGGIVVAAGHDHPALARMCDQALELSRTGVRMIERFGEQLHTPLGQTVQV